MPTGAKSPIREKRDRMKILNLYSGIGGNRKLWGDEHDITAVERNEDIAKIYKDNNPTDEVIVGDAHQFLLENYDQYDFIWSSPPCQSHSKMVKATRHDVRKYPDMILYQEIIFLKNFFKGKWVVENVEPYYTPLIRPDRTIGRHLFWCNFNIFHFNAPEFKGFINSGTIESANKLKEWLGISYEGAIYYDGNHCPSQVLRNCVHPDLGLHIFRESQKDGLFNSRAGVA